MEVIKRQVMQVVGHSPAELNSIGIPVAIARSGGIGVLDLEFCTPQSALLTLRELLRATQGGVGIRLGARSPHEFAALLDELVDRQHWVILSQTSSQTIAERLAMLPRSDQRDLVVEVTDASRLGELQALPVTAIIARGNEAGGRVGEDSSLILLQKVLDGTTLPVYIEGGIGLNGAAACYSAGAAGVVLGAQLLMMPESPLPQSWQEELGGLAGMEAKAYGERIGSSIRVLSRPGYNVSDTLHKLEEELEAASAPAEQWLERALPLVGWSEPGHLAWPVGQELGLAQKYRDQFKTTGRLVKAMKAAANEHPAICKDAPPLLENSPLAESHGTRYPIVQGPMTRVSDSPEFANDVAEAGALPFLALALMRGPQALETLKATSALLGDKPWGVGLLGFVPQQLRDAQVKAIFEVKPPFALIAGGRPDQAAEFERNGIPAYIHVPAPELLKLFLEQGATHFVFEGRECGGHVGPLSSLMLWETMIDVLLHHVPRGKESKVHVLFAGGIHDARSSALISVMAAQLVKRGFRIGVLMGTAYLFTQEIVESGAVKQRYQSEAMACNATVNLETGPGHASRCAVSSFSKFFYKERSRVMSERKPAEEVRDHLEDLNLGRLRLASKGSTRRDGGKLVDVDDAEQVSEGMYMLGQVATLRDRVVAAEDLHRDVSEGSAALLGMSPKRTAPPRREAKPSDIAIIGIGTLLPKAQSASTYWLNIINKVNSITETPRHRWDSRLYFDADRTKRDKIYSKWGGFLDDVAFNPMDYGIPPNSLKSIEPLQLLALETARRALEDAGYADGNFDREHTSVILGAGGGAGDLGMQYAVRSELPRFVEAPLDEAFDRLPEWTEESFPGLLLNVVAGRIANRFDLGGTNCIVDAACASSLAAFDIAVNELESGRSKVAIVGGVDTVQSPFGYLCFSKTQALSPRGKANTFDKSGDGIVISEGLAMVVLKPLADAERDGDRIYSVIKSIGSSSDGKALGLTAPLPAGQMRALKRAYEKAGVSPSTVGLIEAHGTGTAVGDSAEVETITATLRDENATPRSIALGSVKAQLGHTKATAGTAGLVKTVLALHHKVLPPHIGVENPLDPIAVDDSPVYLLDEPRPWLSDGETPRRAGVSAFGFGGTNFHVVMEEYHAEYRAKAQPLGASEWPAELIMFRAPEVGALKTQIGQLARKLSTGAQPLLADVAYTCAVTAERFAVGVQAAVVASDLGELSDALTQLLKVLDGGDAKQLPAHIQLHLDATQDTPTVAFLFPGQGAQYPGMLRESALYVRESREAIEYADKRLLDCYAQPLSKVIYPSQAYSDQDRAAQQQALTNTHVAQPAIVSCSLGYMGLLDRVGVTPHMAAGHSLGEYVALHAAGVISRDAVLDLSQTRGRAMANAGKDGDAGSMAAVMATRDVVDAYLAEQPGLVLANHNAPNQCVISGNTEDIIRATEELKAKGVTVIKLPVAGAFHSPLMNEAQSPLTEAIDKAEFGSPKLPVFGNNSGTVYSNDATAIREQLKGHMLGSVQFVDQIENMYRDGAKVFLEVGPNNVLTGLVGKTLKDRPHTAIATDIKGRGLSGMLSALAQLVGCGVPITASALFVDRQVSRLPNVLPMSTLPATAWLVNGGGIRRQGDLVHRTGKEPAFTVETRAKSAEELANRLAPQRTATPAPQPANTASPQVPATTPAASASTPAPSAPHVPQAPAVNAESAAVQMQALDLYHNTMRQFLSMQEGVMQNFLGGNTASAATSSTVPAPAATVAPASMPAQNVPAPNMIATPTIDATAQNTPLIPAPVTANDIVPPPVVAPPAAPVVEASTATPGMSRDELADLVLRLTAERTGYPAEMLALDQDIEAELGIDSIKRVEIVGALTKELPESMQETLQAEVETLTRAKTLEALIDGLADHLPAASAANVAPAILDAPTNPVAPGLSRDDLADLVLRLTAERTGYPAEMLALDQDIEAELGIDSIKRVEIVGALTKELPETMQQALQAEVETLTRAKTLAALIDGLAEHLPTASSAEVAPSTLSPAAVTAVAPGLSRDELSDLVLRLTAERTGYPVEMLALDQDIEAELGIDSIKRVEIVGALTKELPESMQQTLQSEVETLTRAKTLAALIEGLTAHVESPTSSVAPSPAPEPVATQSAVVTPLAVEVPRFTMASQFQARPESISKPDTGLYLVTDDGEGFAAPVIEELQRRGAQVVLLTHDLLDEPARLQATLDNLRSGNVSVVGIVHLAGLANGGSMRSLETWRNSGNRNNKAFFRLLKACASDFDGDTNARVLNVSGNGGHFGRNGQMATPTAGGSVGLLKSALAEWPQLKIKNLDLEAASSVNAGLIVDELLCDPDAVEVGYSGGERHVFFTVAAPTNGDSNTQNELVPQPDSIVLATGGARGITFNVLDAMMPDGATVVLMARSSEPGPEPEGLATAVDSSDLRSALLKEAKAQGEKPSLAMLEKRVNAVLRDRSIRANISSLRQRGITVEYQQADVSDEQQCNAAIDAIYERHGRIDGVIHGAGIIEDKLIIDKSQESFDRVYDTKADSGYLLSQRLRPDSLKWMMFFTSVAGRYGNRGQGDYAAGNEVLNRLAWQLNSQWTSTRVMSVNWGPWDSGGMVSEGVKRQFAELGIVAITPLCGVTFACDEIASGLPNDVEVVAGQGPWDSEASQILNANNSSDFDSKFNLVLAVENPQMEPTGAVIMSRAFSVSGDPYLLDHRLDGDPVVPAAVCTEWMAETTQLAWPDLVVAEVQDVRVLQGIQFGENESAPLQVRCRVSSHADAAAVKVSTELKDTRTGRTAYRAGVLLRDRLPPAPLASLLPLSAGEPLDALTAYRDYLFHGPRFQLITAIERMNEQGIDAQIRCSDVLQWIDATRRSSNGAAWPPNWLFDPGLMDVCLQMSMIWGRVHKGISALPVRFGAIRRYQIDTVPDKLMLHYRIRPETSTTSVVFDAELCTPEGQVFMSLENVESTGSASFNRLADNTDEMGRPIITKVGQAR